MEASLIEFIRQGNIQSIRDYLRVTPNALDAVDVDGLNCLHWAAYFDEAEMLEFLVAQEPKLIPQATNKGQSVVHVAVQQGSKRVLNYIGGHAPFRDLLNLQSHWGETPLHLAAASGKSDIIQLLIGFGSSQSLQDKWGRTPADVLIENGYSSLVPLFDPQFIRSATMEDSTRVSHESTLQNKSVISEFMSRVKSAPPASSGATETESMVVVRSIFSDRIESIQGGTINQTGTPQAPAPVAVAPAAARRISVSQQIEYPGDPVRLAEMVADPVRYDVNGRDMFGWTALHKVCMWDKVDLLEILLSSGEIDVKCVSKNREAFGVLHCCVEAGAARCSERLLRLPEREALLSAVDSSGRTAAQFADS